MQVLSFNAESPEQHATLVALFDRTDEYAQAIRRLEALKNELPEAVRARSAATVGECGSGEVATISRT